MKGELAKDHMLGMQNEMGILGKVLGMKGEDHELGMKANKVGILGKVLGMKAKDHSVRIQWKVLGSELLKFPLKLDSGRHVYHIPVARRLLDFVFSGSQVHTSLKPTPDKYSKTYLGWMAEEFGSYFRARSVCCRVMLWSIVRQFPSCMHHFMACLILVETMGGVRLFTEFPEPEWCENLP